jgi:hypothetical protein
MDRSGLQSEETWSGGVIAEGDPPSWWKETTASAERERGGKAEDRDG